MVRHGGAAGGAQQRKRRGGELGSSVLWERGNAQVAATRAGSAKLFGDPSRVGEGGYLLVSKRARAQGLIPFRASSSSVLPQLMPLVFSIRGYNFGRVHRRFRKIQGGTGLFKAPFATLYLAG